VATRHSTRPLLIRAACSALLLAAVSAGCDRDSPAPIVINGTTMGTWYSVKLPSLEQGTPEELQAEIDQRLERINDLMSPWREDSELSRFNRWTSGDWFEVSSETARVMIEALRVARLTEGALDITVGPLVELWNFGPNRGEFTLPTDEEIFAIMARVGYARLEVRDAPPAARKRRGDLVVDLSAIAKGYGVDEVAALLERGGVQDYMVEIGGEIRTRGTKADGTPWTVGIETPEPGRRSVLKALKLGDAGMATSGDYRNYHERDGKRYSHMIDPRTGRPIEHRLASVSVVAGDCMHADAMATALMILGPEDGYRLASDHDLAALFIVREASGLAERATPAFESLLDRQDLK
jgi:thiamine biosynthesis lipoprotein